MKTSRLPLAAAFLAALILPPALRAATATVNGIEWTYNVSDGKATVGGGQSWTTAVPQDTSGAITIPAKLGGYPVTTIGANSAFVDVLYQTFLDRAPDSKGKASWLSRLKSGVSRNTVMAGFYSSTEFSQLMAKYGIRTTSGTASGPASGTWKGTSASSQVSSKLVLSDSSGNISGTLYWPKGDTRSVRGSRSGNSVTLNIAGGDVWRLTISGNKLAGTASKKGGGSYICAFTRQ